MQVIFWIEASGIIYFKTPINVRPPINKRWGQLNTKGLAAIFFKNIMCRPSNLKFFRKQSGSRLKFGMGLI